MIELNDEILENCILCTSKDEARPNLQGVYIKDTPGERREYVATNGRILVKYNVGYEGDKLEKPILIKPHHKIKKNKDCNDCFLEVHDNGDAILTQLNGIKTVFALEDAEHFPEYDKMFKEVGKLWNEYTIMNPKHMDIAQRVLGLDYLPAPYAKGEGAPCYWHSVYMHSKYSGEVEVLIMPMKKEE